MEASSGAVVAEADPPPEPIETLSPFEALTADPSISSLIVVLEHLETLSTAEIEAAIDNAWRAGQFRLIPHLLAGWLERDPQGLLDYLLNNPNRRMARRYLRGVFERWAKLDAEAALNAARSMERSPLKMTALSSIVSIVANDDPAKALALARGLNMDTQFEEQAIRDIFSAWARGNPAAARQAMEALPTETKNAALMGYFDSRARMDVQAAAEEAMAIRDPREQLRAMAMLFLRWTEQDPAAALAFFVERAPPETRRHGLFTIAYQAAEADPHLALAWADGKLRGEERDEAIGIVIGRLAESDPAAAAAFVEQLPFGRAYENSIDRLASTWGRDDPAVALPWFRSLPEGAAREKALRAITTRLVNADPAGALNYAASLTDETERRAVFEAVAQAKASVDPVAALQWTQNLGDGVRDLAREQVLLAWVDQDPKAFAAHFSDSRNPPSPELSEQAADRWAKKDPRAAAEWALSLADEESRGRAINKATIEWIQQDSYAASVWIEQMPRGNARDKAVMNVVELVGGSDPAAAFAWSVTLDNPDNRLRYAEIVFRDWHQEDPERARQALEASGLSSEEKARVGGDFGW